MRSRVSRKGAAFLLAMIVLAVLSAWAVSICSLTGNNVRLADNQQKINSALSAAQSGLECGRYLAATVTLDKTPDNTVSSTQANKAWTDFCTYVKTNKLDNQVVPAASRFTDAGGAGDQLVLPSMNFGSQAAFQVRFYRYDSNSRNFYIRSTGTDGQAARTITLSMPVTKDNQVMHYALAGQCRIWITGDSTIHGNIYSSWKYQNISPFNMTSDSKVLGTINTILTNIKPSTGKAGPDLYAGTTKMPYDLETLDSSGKPEYDSHGNKIISPTDEIQGQSEGINYNVSYGDKAANMPGMKLSDYDTSTYKNQTSLPAKDSTVYNYNKDSHGNPTTAKTVTEYFPHAVDSSGNPLYGTASSSGSLKLTRYVCQNKTLTNFQVGKGKNSLFQNCTFNGILYVDNAGSANDVRFENCVFNGPIVTTPSTDTSSGWWQRNQLYFTGAETFQNQTTVPATILAPNFNVNIGNTDPTNHDNSILTGAIVGGIVDVRGNAQVYGTIISMFDTSAYNSGYVSNIGATTKDGGSETVMVGDIGNIDITPDPSKLLPSGIITPLVIRPNMATYSESI